MSQSPSISTGVGPDGQKLREGAELEEFAEKMAMGFFQGMFFYDWLIMRTACQVAKDLMEGEGEFARSDVREPTLDLRLL